MKYAAVIELRFGMALLCATLIAASPSSAVAQQVEVDITACRGMYDVLKRMSENAPREEITRMLDALLETPSYRIMFKHYNRSWRPNHLPEDVFERMILSLRSEGAYAPGENGRADAMRAQWIKYYPDLSLYERRLRQLEASNLPKLIKDGVEYAQGWLPLGWKIPDFQFVVIPHGGSPAFALEKVQGYDFLQLSQGATGELDLKWLVGTVAHESHHLGMRSTAPASLSASDAMAYRVLNLCVAEGAATAFISGPPEGRAPAVPGVPFHLYPGNLAKAWSAHVDDEAEILKRQLELLDQACAGELTEEAFNAQLRDYWLSGAVGRAYVLGADMFGAIFLAFGIQGAFAAMQDPRKLFELYNSALDARPGALKRCVRVPDASVKKALAIGTDRRP